MQVSGLLDLRMATKIACSLDSFKDVEIELCLFDWLINVIARWGYCTISFNSAVTRHAALKIAEM